VINSGHAIVDRSAETTVRLEPAPGSELLAEIPAGR